jgi:hypothetical protein
MALGLTQLVTEMNVRNDLGGLRAAVAYVSRLSRKHGRLDVSVLMGLHGLLQG